MLRFKPFLKVNPVFKHVAILNILTYLGTKPVFRFMTEFVTLTDFMTSVKLPTLEKIANYKHEDRDKTIIQ